MSLPSHNALSRARRVFADQGGMLRTTEAIRRGIHPRDLYSLRDRGELEEVARGVYRLVSAPPLTSPDLVAVALRVPKRCRMPHLGVGTAPPHKEIPHAIDLALPSHSQLPRIGAVPLRVFWYAEPSYSAGVENFLVDRVPVRRYSAEKTIADCFKYRNKIGLDVAIEGLRTYRERKRRPDIKALTHFAQMDKVLRVMQPYLEAIL
jgi:predicted transcriptional regulator of viral defense system